MWKKIIEINFCNSDLFRKIIFLFNEFSEKFQIKETDNKKIPKVIHMTYISYEHVPQKVWDNLKKFAPDYKILFYSDEACKDFLKKNFFFRVVTISVSGLLRV